jgi:hypothetical protein
MANATYNSTGRATILHRALLEVMKKTTDPVERRFAASSFLSLFPSGASSSYRPTTYEMAAGRARKFSDFLKPRAG